MWWSTKPAKAADITAAELRAEFAECKASVRALELEWERTYAKLRGIVARMSRKNGEIDDAAPAAPVAATAFPTTESQLHRGVSRLPRRNY